MLCVLYLFSTLAQLHIRAPYKAPSTILANWVISQFLPHSLEHHLSLALLILQILVGAECRCPSEKHDNVETNTHARRLIRNHWLGGCSVCLWYWVALLCKCLSETTRYESIRTGPAWKHTERFKVPIIRPWRISRASSLCPTSSNASVASWPATSRSTSSPPLI